MKKLILSQLVLLVMASLFLFSCGGSDDKVEPIIPNPEGFYITGINTIAVDLTDANARMPLAVLEDQVDATKTKTTDGIYGKLVYIGAGSTVNFTNVVAGVTTVYGAPSGGTVSNQFESGPATINDDIISGTLTEGAPAIAVAQEGYYYAYVNIDTKYFAMAKLKPNVIGDATTGNGTGWDAGKNLAVKSISKDEVVFEGTDMAMYNAHGYRYRFFNGWQIYSVAAENIITDTNLAVESYGAAWDAQATEIGYFRDNIPFFEPTGYYTITLKYTFATGKWTDTKVKTGDILIDYSETVIGFFGNAWDGGAWSQETAYDVKAPVKDGNVYTWTWNAVTLIEGNEFVVLENGIWGGLQLFWNDGMARDGNAFANNNITKGDGSENFHVSTGGVYNIQLVINAATSVKTLKINAAP